MGEEWRAVELAAVVYDFRCTAATEMERKAESRAW